jgi:tetratricopeptide (TPR) repeat protein
LVFDRLGQFQMLTDPLVRGKERARGHFEEAVRLAPNSPLAHRHLGQIRLLQGARDDAFKEFDQSLKLRRTPQGLSAVGSAYYSAGLSDQALKYFEEALRMDPTRYTYHLGAALALRQARDRKVESDAHFAQALRQTEDILSANKGKSLVRAARGLCEAALGHLEEARRDLEQAVSEAPLDAQVLQMAYRGYQVLPDPTRASEILRLINLHAR